VREAESVLARIVQLISVNRAETEGFIQEAVAYRRELHDARFLVNNLVERGMREIAEVGGHDWVEGYAENIGKIIEGLSLEHDDEAQYVVN
jgi:hypothetical protein